jgi:CRP-like cAMP-binding protein
MTLPPRSIIDTRRDQMFPVLEPEEIERVSRFGEVRSYLAGDAIVTVGRVSPGVIVILSGKVDVTQRDQSGHRTLIVIHSAGEFMGEGFYFSLASGSLSAASTADRQGSFPRHGPFSVYVPIPRKVPPQLVSSQDQ